MLMGAWRIYCSERAERERERKREREREKTRRNSMPREFETRNDAQLKEKKTHKEAYNSKKKKKKKTQRDRWYGANA